MSENFAIIIGFVIAFICVFFAIPKIILVSNAKNLFDVPNERGANKAKIIPNIGGIGIFAGICTGAIIALNSYDINLVSSLILSALIMFLIGLKDDIIGLSAWKKLIGQLVVVAYLIFVCNIRITNLHGIFGIYDINYLPSTILTIVVYIGLINAFNLIDGIDGLASGVGIVISSAYGLLFLYLNLIEYSALSFSITGSLVAFFFYNVFGKKNKIFMGDTGSLTLGVCFAIITIWFNELPPLNRSLNVFAFAPAISIAIMIVPVIDALRVMAVRIWTKKSPFKPDMNHIHHHLLRITGNHLHSSLIIVFANIIFIALLFALIKMTEINALFFSILTLGFITSYIPVLINTIKTMIEKSAHKDYIFDVDNNQRNDTPERIENNEPIEKQEKILLDKFSSTFEKIFPN